MVVLQLMLAEEPPEIGIPQTEPEQDLPALRGTHSRHQPIAQSILESIHETTLPPHRPARAPQSPTCGQPIDLENPPTVNRPRK